MWIEPTELSLSVAGSTDPVYVARTCQFALDDFKPLPDEIVPGANSDLVDKLTVVTSGFTMNFPRIETEKS